MLIMVILQLIQLLKKLKSKIKEKFFSLLTIFLLIYFDT